MHRNIRDTLRDCANGEQYRHHACTRAGLNSFESPTAQTATFKLSRMHWIAIGVNLDRYRATEYFRGPWFKPCGGALEKLIPPILAVLMAAGAALLHWGPVTHYAVECQRTSVVSCTIERSKSAGATERWNLTLGPDANATVRVIPRRRSDPSVYLYLRSNGEDIFAAQFEGSNAASEAEAAASRLNQVFGSTFPATARIEARPPAYFRWVSWGGLGVMALLSITLCRKVYFPKKRPDSSPAHTLVDSGAQ